MHVRSFIHCENAFVYVSLRDPDPLPGPSLKCPQVFLVERSMAGEFCAACTITLWSHLSLAGLQPGLRPSPSRPSIFLKVVAQTVVPSCFLETAQAILLENANLCLSDGCANHGVPLAGAGSL